MLVPFQRETKPEAPEPIVERYVVASVNRAPPLVDLTRPAPREERVVEPVAERVPVMLVVASVEVPVTYNCPERDKEVAEALANVV